MRFSFEQIGDVVSDALLLLSPDGTIMGANRAASILLDTGSEELVGKNIQQCLTDAPTNVGHYLRLCSRSASPTIGVLNWSVDSKPVPTRCEGRLVQPDSRPKGRLIVLKVTPKEQTLNRFLVLNEKISQLGREIQAKAAAQLALEQSESKFRFLAEFIPQIVWTARPDGLHDYYNRRWFDYTGFTLDQTRGHGWQAALHADDLPKCVEQWSRSIATGEPYEVECRLHRKGDGEYRWHLSRAVPLRDSRGLITKWFGSSTDVHDAKVAQQALLRSEKLAAAGRLAATIAHEINNPLEAVINLLYLAQRGVEPGHPVLEYLALADQELARVSEIARQTLGFYRDGSSPVSFALCDVIQTAVRLYSRRAQRRGVQITVECEPEITVKAAQGEIRQVLANLISNALDACPSDGRVRVHAYETRHRSNSNAPGVRIIVADNGAGIDCKTLARIFEPFFSTKKDIGTGLGLWVTREIVEKHGGTIRVRSTQKGSRTGSVFSIFLPAAESQRRVSADAHAA
ncbi:MAG TPA: ATP-binding protein [Terriglobales bacterium]|nr:ATP-binding protein [Terriglobales bacterium]